MGFDKKRSLVRIKRQEVDDYTPSGVILQSNMVLSVSPFPLFSCQQKFYLQMLAGLASSLSKNPPA
jgi:hypothetical protein